MAPQTAVRVGLLLTLFLLAAPAAAGTAVETVTLTDFQLAPPSGGYEAGTWTFAAHNAGAVTHVFAIQSPAGVSVAGPVTVSPGLTRTLPNVAFSPGLYTFICTLHPQSMRAQVAFRGIGNGSFGAVGSISDAGAFVSAMAIANGDTAVNATLTVRVAGTGTLVRSVDVPVSGFAETPVGQRLNGLAESTRYMVTLVVHGDRGASTPVSTTFTTRAADTRPPVVRVAVPRQRSVRAWTTLHGTAIDPGASWGLAHVELSVSLRRGRTCARYTGRTFVSASCAARPFYFEVPIARSRFALTLVGLHAGEIIVRSRAFDVAGHTGAGATVAALLRA